MTNKPISSPSRIRHEVTPGTTWARRRGARSRGWIIAQSSRFLIRALLWTSNALLLLLVRLLAQGALSRDGTRAMLATSRVLQRWSFHLLRNEVQRDRDQ
jgi:hypothetical protein